MRRIPNFVLLRAFESAARLGSFAAAAAELSLTPSAISHQIKELEDVFRKPLFYRRHRRVDLTAEGARFADSLTRVLNALEASCSEVSLAPAGQVLSLYCAPSFAAKWLGPRLGAFTQRHPDIAIRLTTAAEPLDLIRAREVDIAISYGMAVQRTGIAVSPLGKESIVPLCAPSVVANKRNARKLISEFNLIESQLSRVTWRDWFAMNGITAAPKVNQSFDRAALAISAAVDGLGIALESTRFAEKELARGELIELGAREFPRVARETHFFSVRTEEQEIPKIQIFRNWLMSCLNLI
ncbi:LysR substrate-binding domain-containing protein [Achromobacter xylosoxidans]|uniref:LysR family transcriptional regulator n=1 Tax=Alcaligenes xylosoxydans xylosoxydans TaxID=85698 RepID=A0A1R1JSX5_ALCXX|nr:LysR substrate-binding domain-containing protein [Achromobacter xylosoxidans]MCV6905125.1 LysR substrate-binding domain-containing protein [Achromobacter xylosoxidans]OMG86340.1 LysR family transcriptional regulator [Achromobacter xylosoxidans]BEG74980.1 HTH-type transcriptional regulator PerR [Achromobacter xylosoxidans]